jgi:hypothetical protein
MKDVPAATDTFFDQVFAIKKNATDVDRSSFTDRRGNGTFGQALERLRTSSPPTLSSISWRRGRRLYGTSAPG